MATSKNKVIGTRGRLPWYIPEELKRFKKITMGHPIIMGRKTHESIGKSLPGRTNIVITRDKSYQGSAGAIVTNSLDQAIEIAKKSEGSEEIFVIGGGEIYQLALPLTDKLYLTLVDKDFEGDVYFPDYSEFNKVQSEPKEANGLKFTFFELERV